MKPTEQELETIRRMEAESRRAQAEGRIDYIGRPPYRIRRKWRLVINPWRKKA